MKTIFSSKLGKLLFSFSISLALLAWLAYSINWQQLGQQISQINYFLLIPAALALLAHMFVRAVRWRIFLPDEGKISNLTLFDSIMVGAFATFVLPLRAGEFVRPAMLSLRSKYSFSTCFVSVVIERFFDLSVVLIGFGVMLYLIPGIDPRLRQVAISFSVLAFGIMLFMLLGSLFPKQIESLIHWIAGFLPPRFANLIKGFLIDFLQGARVLNSPIKLLKATIASLLVWLTNFLCFYAFMFIFNMVPSFAAATSTAIILALAVALPSAPGFLGVYQAGCLAGFALFGYSEAQAAAYSLVTHALQYVVFISYGLIILFKYEISLADLRRS